MKGFGFLAISALAFAIPANAANVLSDNFDSEQPGSVLNYTGFANFDVIDGTVDYLNGYPSLSCAGGSGGCIDLDGSTGNGGTIVTKLGYAFNAGDFVSLSFDLSGSQRGSTETVNFGFFSQGAAINYNDVMVDIGGGPLAFGNINQLDLDVSFGGILSSFGYTSILVSFTAGNAGTIKAYLGSPSVDNVGVLVDNVSLNITPNAVPEPATWAMMIGGFALAGAAMRRRKAVLSFA